MELMPTVVERSHPEYPWIATVATADAMLTMGVFKTKARAEAWATATAVLIGAALPQIQDEAALEAWLDRHVGPDDWDEIQTH